MVYSTVAGPRYALTTERAVQINLRQATRVHVSAQTDVDPMRDFHVWDVCDLTVVFMF